MKVVTDTNVLVSGTFWRGGSSRILDSIDRGEMELVLSEEMIEEYSEVINRDEIMDKILNKNLILNKSIQGIIRDSRIVVPLQKFDIVKEDPSDNKVLECAFEGSVDYIISQDNHLLKLKEFKGMKIISPKEFIELMEDIN